MTLLEQMDPDVLVSPLLLQPGDKVMGISQDSIGKNTSCYSCRIGLLSTQALSVAGCFAQRMQQYFLAQDIRLSGSKHQRPALKLVAR